jgi:hypothetical protein
MKVVGGNPDPEVSGVEELPGKSHYFIGADPSRWQRDVPHYARVRYHEVYPGVDLVFYGRQGGRLEYDFVVSPGADPRRIRLRFDGAERKSLDEEGKLVLRVGEGRLEQHAPFAYQEVEGQRQQVVASYVLHRGGEVGFEVGPYDKARPIVIDPALEYSTYLGGSTDADYGRGIALDSAGNAYVTGGTSSADFPTLNPYQTDLGYEDVFVTKFSPSGSGLVYSTYLGGSGYDSGYGIAVDGSGSAYVAGYTDSTDFPTLNPFQSDQGDVDLFVTKLPPSGSSLVYSTYLGGSGNDSGLSRAGAIIAVDASGSAYVTGYTSSKDFPTLNPYQAYQGGADVVVTKLSPSGSSLVYSTYLGGSSTDFGSAIAVDGSGSAYVTGGTSSPDFPTLSPYQAYQGGVDAFVTKLSLSGSSLAHSTYLGGGANDSGYAIGLDGSGSAYVTGYTDSTNFPTLNPYQTDQGGADVFVTKLSLSGSGLVYSTYLGGSAGDDVSGLAVDASGSAYVTGATLSTDFPTLNPYQTDQGGADVFVTKLSPSGSGLVYSTYLGGSGSETGYGIAVEGSGSAYVTGHTDSTDFPTRNAYQASYGGLTDAFVAKLAASTPAAYHTLMPCRAVDTRNPPGPLGGPALACSSAPLPRTFPLNGACGIPPTARAISYNVAVTQPTAAGNLRLFPAGSLTPLVSSINYAAGATRGNNGVVLLGTGNLNVTCHQGSGTAHVIIDVNGYFE